MAQYRKKPIVIEGYCATTDSVFPEWLSNAIESGTVHVEPSGPIYITTLEGTMRADFGDYIIRGVKGELYPCKPDIFEATYTPEAAFAGDTGPSPDWRGSVPWQALDTVLLAAQSNLDHYEESAARRIDADCKTCYAWRDTNAPKEKA